MYFQEPLLEDTAEYIKQLCLTHLTERISKEGTILKSLCSSKSSCSLHIQYFHFPLSPPNAVFSSDLLEVAVDEEAGDIGSLPDQLPSDSWQARRSQEWIHRLCVQSQKGTQLNYLRPLAQHHL